MRNFWSKQVPTLASSGQVGSWEAIEVSSLLAISETTFKLPVSLVVPNLAYNASKLDLKPVISVFVRLTGTWVTGVEPEGAGLGLVEVVADPEGAGLGLVEAVGFGEGVPPPPPPEELLPDGLGELEARVEGEGATHRLLWQILDAQSLFLLQEEPVEVLPPAHLPPLQEFDWHSSLFLQASPPLFEPCEHFPPLQTPDWHSVPWLQVASLFFDPVESEPVPSHLVVEFESEGTKA